MSSDFISVANICCIGNIYVVGTGNETEKLQPSAAHVAVSNILHKVNSISDMPPKQGCCDLFFDIIYYTHLIRHLLIMTYIKYTLWGLNEP